MKRLLANVASVLTLLVILTLANAAQLKEAHVTQIVSDVKLLPQQAAPRPAAVNDLVRNGTAVRTGTQSRSELTFADLTITRLGANTIFSFEQGTRTMDLRDGAVLFQVPKGSGGATIRTTAVTAAITGTTGIGEFHPATASHPQPFSKWLCLEGVFHLTLPNGQSVELGPGKMVTTDGKTFSPILTFDIGQVMKTSLLVNGFDTPLASLPLILIEENNQVALRTPITNRSTLFDPSNIIDVVDQGMTAQQSPTVTPTPPITPTPSTPTPTPSKFGTLTTITSPDPYVISGGTTITTDPSITTNGQTDYGKIYRSQAQDGLLSAFLFGSTSAFDTASGFDAELGSPAMGGAGFKFTSLKLTGNPTISTIGGTVYLGLIAVNGITSSGPGGVLTFAGIRGLLLATQNGSINLGPEISFSGLQDITFYARGSGSMLTLASDVSTTNTIRLYGEGGIQLSSDLSTQDLIAFTNGDFDFNGGSIDAETISIISGGDLNLALSSALNIGNDLSLTTRPGDINSGGLITVTNPGNAVIGGALTLLVDNSNGGHIGTGGNISFTTGGNLTSDSINAFVNNRNGGVINNGGNLTFDIGGALTTQHDLSEGDAAGESLFLLISNRNDGDGGGTIGSNVILSLNAASVSVGGNMFAGISTNYGGNVPMASVNINISGDLFVQGNAADADTFGQVEGASIDIENTGTFTVDGAPLVGGTIGSDAIINLSAHNVSGSLDLEILNEGRRGTGGQFVAGGTIGSDATINLTVRNVSGDSFFASILNYRGGTIGSDATININAASIFSASSDGFEDASISNYDGGHIGGSAFINFGVTGAMDTAGELDFSISNQDLSGRGGGTIGGDAMINVTTNNISLGGSLNAFIANQQGSIGGAATINFELTGALTAAGDATFSIDGSNGGAIGSDAKINVSAASITTDGALSVNIDNNSAGHIGGDASLLVSTGGTLTASTLTLLLNNRDGGTIDGNGLVSLSTGGAITTTGDATVVISNRDDGGGFGTIGGNASVILTAASANIGGNLVVASPSEGAGGQLASALVTVNVAGDVSTGGSLQFSAQNGGLNPLGEFHGGGIINQDAVASLTAANVTIGDFFLGLISNLDGGQIGGTAGLAAILTGDLNAAGDAAFQIDNSTTMGTLTSTIGSDAAIGVTVNNLTAGSLEVQIFNQGGSSIGGNATINVNAGSISTAGTLDAEIDNFSGGTIGQDAIVSVTTSGDINTPGNAVFNIFNSDFSSGSGAGSIVGNATINVSAASITAGVLFAQIVNLGSTIDGNGTIDVLAPSGIISGGDASITIFNADNHAVGPAGTIGGDATINVNAGDISIIGSLENAIYNTFVQSSTAGSISGNATLTFDAGAITIQDAASFKIDSNDGAEIGGNATINLSATSLSVEGPLGLLVHIINFDGGTIGQEALIDFGIAGDVNIQNDATFQILNHDGDIGLGGGTIGGNATINVTAVNVTANSLLTQIVNNGGTIGGNATINMNVSGDATVTGDATVQILGSDGAEASAININGGSYDAGGTFLTEIDGDGAITFNNVIGHADVLKVGALGTNGVLTIGGGSLSADTTLKLYASGSNGQINFIADVTLGGDSAKIIAADSVTIFNGVTVTVGNIADENPADVYTNHANYSGFGGNGSTTGTFAGSGANDPQPLDSAPPFDESPRPAAAHPRAHVSTGPRHTSSTTHAGGPSRRPGSDANVASRRRSGPAIRIKDSGELLSLLDRTTLGPGGKITVPNSNSTSNGNPANPASGASATRRAVNVPNAPAYPPSRLP